MLELRKLNDINNNLKQELIDNGYNEIIVNLLVNRGYDENILEYAIKNNVLIWDREKLKLLIDIANYL